ncbi:hypothetical protein I6I18_01160 [Kytococcus sedentarius]|uniref:Uncharacterized protein n=1 Tax=Kytococcus sedentarius (strain ATCC 14392 / DSM 20547 / JCM 11482 / CCUG 33030 / NBRC 15357 / NCTC 11040 / CCM 314 / 541) TaxID=478801 RepID=C7NLS2_KYTSD|nr:hypothetical protein [Kytococcus sedentarius]ACV05738.1 hypothetical protein Ksed_06760 [Kytococcus sedentarius DSM 20547]QQB64152.1 hypothetical protein I6I18_01160 [Kytococcus sedentarius]STX12849.1 Uncharacterised protein [Kytococcus sedentarius]
MPTYYDSLQDAAEASEALRGLAHASRVFDNPADTYSVLGDLLSGVRSLRQVLDQLGSAHLVHRGRAHDDDGDHAIGAAEALAAADDLHHAGTLLDGVEERGNAAMTHSGRIAWHAPTQELDREAVSPDEPRRWISVVFLQGAEADEVLDLIDRDGPDAAIEHLRNWDCGEETTDAALENGYVYDEPPTGQLDRVITDGDYTLTYNPFMGHVSLLRAHPAAMSDPDLDETDVVLAREAISGVGPLDASTPRTAVTPASAQTQQASAGLDRDWFAGPARSSGSIGRGLSL